MVFRRTIAGMLLAGLILGVVLGQVIGTKPRIISGLQDAGELPQAGTAIEPIDEIAESEYPNHYPMVTRNGVIEVEELSMYVRNRDAWRSTAQLGDWYSLAAYDADFDAELTAAHARMEAELRAASRYDSFDIAAQTKRKPQAGASVGSEYAQPRIEVDMRALPLDLRGVVEATKGSGTRLPAAGEALLASPVER